MPSLPFQEETLLLVTDKHGAAQPPWRAAFWLVMLGSSLRQVLMALVRKVRSGEADLSWGDFAMTALCLWFCAGLSANRVREVPP